MHFFLTDGLGSTRALLNTSGTVTDQYTYDAYGNTVVSAGSTLNRYLYTGEQWDSDLNMYYLRARYMNPNLGRFWSMDTYEGEQIDPLSLHKYLYVSANPVNMVDFAGLNGDSISTGAAVGGASTLGASSGSVASWAMTRAGLKVIAAFVWANIKMDVYTDAISYAVIPLTSASADWLSEAIFNAAKNNEKVVSTNGGDIMEKVAGAKSTAYEVIDHIIDEPNGKKALSVY